MLTKAPNTALANSHPARVRNTTVVLLSDGAPNFMDCAMNYVGTYDQHRDLINTQNTQGARVNCFGIGIATDVDADPRAAGEVDAQDQEHLVRVELREHEGDLEGEFGGETFFTLDFMPAE